MSLDDDRVRFYFKHREQIEQWAALRSEASVAVDEWMTELSPSVDDLVRSLGEDVRVAPFLGPEEAFPSYCLTKASWNVASVEKPPVSVCLEWPRGRTTMKAGACPYIGIRSAKTTDIGALLRQSEAVRQTRLQRKDLSSAWWPAYVNMVPTQDFPLGLDAFRDALVDSLRAAWLAYEPLISHQLVST